MSERARCERQEFSKGTQIKFKTIKGKSLCQVLSLGNYEREQKIKLIKGKKFKRHYVPLPVKLRCCWES